MLFVIFVRLYVRHIQYLTGSHTFR